MNYLYDSSDILPHYATVKDRIKKRAPKLLRGRPVIDLYLDGWTEDDLMSNLNCTAEEIDLWPDDRLPWEFEMYLAEFLETGKAASRRQMSIPVALTIFGNMKKLSRFFKRPIGYSKALRESESLVTELMMGGLVESDIVKK